MDYRHDLLGVRLDLFGQQEGEAAEDQQAGQQNDERRLAPKVWSVSDAGPFLG
jgi:hypothetical protein